MGTSLVKFGKDTARDVKQVARGWRWGRRPQVPRSAEPYVIPKETSVFPTKWARTPAAIAVRDMMQKGAAERGPELRGQPAGERARLAAQARRPGDHRGEPLVAPGHPAAAAARCRTRCAARRRSRPPPTTSSTPGGGRPRRRSCSTRSRSSAAAASSARRPGDLLADGWNVVVFPEGTRSPDGWMERFRMGAAYLAVEHGVPVIPVGIKGSFAAMPRGRGWPIPGRPAVARPVRRPAEGRRGRERPRLRTPDRGRCLGPPRRGIHHLVRVPPPRRRRRLPLPDRPRRSPLAPSLGVHPPHEVHRQPPPRLEVGAGRFGVDARLAA